MQETEEILSRQEKIRYQRHMALSEIGQAGQEKLKRSRVLVVGAGGLGCPALLYLNAAGIGTIGIVDGDTVGLSNLQRQILYREKDVGKLKTNCAREYLQQQNPHTQWKLYSEFLSVQNAISIFRNFDLVLDCSDNFATRYLVNDACYFLSKPFVHGSVYSYEGWSGIFLNHPNSPCYRCLFPHPPGLNEGALNCSQVGVLGVVPGMIGNWQASLALHFFLSLSPASTPSSVSENKMAKFNAQTGDLLTIKIAKDQNCPLCGPSPSITQLQTITQSSISHQCLGDSNEWEISLEDFFRFHNRDHDPENFVIDIREKFEVAIDPNPYRNIPLSELASTIADLPSDQKYLFVCASGKRGKKAIELAQQMGCKNFYNLKDGLHSQK